MNRALFGLFIASLARRRLATALALFAIALGVALGLAVQLIHGAAIEMARTHPQAVAVCLHPGTVATPLTAKYAGGHKVVAPEAAARNLLTVARALGPDQSGGFFDYSGAPVPW